MLLFVKTSPLGGSDQINRMPPYVHVSYRWKPKHVLCRLRTADGSCIGLMYPARNASALHPLGPIVIQTAEVWSIRAQ